MPYGHSDVLPTDTAPWIWPLVLDRLRSAKQPLTVVGDQRPPTEHDLITQALLRSCPFGVVIGDVRGRVQGANDAFLALTNYDRSLLDGGSVRWDDLTPDEHCAADQRAIDQAVLNGECEPYEKELIGRDGRHIPVRVSFAILDLPAGLIAAYTIDLSQSRAEEARLVAIARRGEILLQVSEAAITGLLDRAALTELMFEKAASVVQADHWTSFRLSADIAELALVSSRGMSGGQLPSVLHVLGGISVPPTTTAATVMAETLQVAIDAQEPAARRFGLGAVSGHLLVDTTGRTLGIATVIPRNCNGFEPDEIEFIQAIVHIMALAWQRFDDDERREGNAKHRLAMQSASTSGLERPGIDQMTSVAFGENRAASLGEPHLGLLRLQPMECLPQPMLPIFRGMLDYAAMADPARSTVSMRPARALSDPRPIVERQHNFLRTIMAEHLREKGFLVLSAAEVAAGLGMLLMEEPLDLFISDMSSPGLHASALARESAIRSRIRSGGKVYTIEDLASEAALLREGRCLFLPGHICLPSLATSANEQSARRSRKSEG